MVNVKVKVKVKGPNKNLPLTRLGERRIDT